jgi:hypothetical protein
MLDSDGDGYADHDEILHQGDAFNANVVPPHDQDHDGFSDEEELRLGTLPNDATSHPPGGFMTPYLDLTDLVITEFMLKNRSTLEQTTAGIKRTDDWVEIYNPTELTIRLNEDTNENGILDLSEDANGNGVLDPGEDTNGNGVLDPSEDYNQNGKLDFYALTDGTVDSVKRSRRLPSDIVFRDLKPKRFLLILVDGAVGRAANADLDPRFPRTTWKYRAVPRGLRISPPPPLCLPRRRLISLRFRRPQGR